MIERQGLLKGDINFPQQIAVAWLLGQDQDNMLELENLRALYTGLATNPATSRDFILKLMEENQVIEEVQTDEKWTTPESVQDIQEFLRLNA